MHVYFKCDYHIVFRTKYHFQILEGMVKSLVEHDLQAVGFRCFRVENLVTVY